MSSSHRRAGASVLLALALAVPGCAKQSALLVPSSEPPALSLRAERVADASSGAAAFRVSWVMTAGSAHYFDFAVNPASPDHVDSNWRSMSQRSWLVAVPRPAAGAPISPAGATTFAIQAVDGLGRRSEVESIAFVGANIVPTVQITSPTPSFVTQFVPPTFPVTWQGSDPDGTPNPVPAIYKWKLLTSATEVTLAQARVDPDSVRRYYEPRHYAGWDSTTGNASGEASTVVTGLVPGNDYGFVVVARDAEGAWNQIFSLSRNILTVRCVAPATAGPLLTIYGDTFRYTYANASYSTDPANEIPTSIPAGERVTIHWVGMPQPLTTIAGYRWGLDLENPLDTESRPSRGNGRNRGWSELDPNTTSAVVGPFAPGSTHRLYIESRDSNGLRSLGVVRIGAFVSTPVRPLLIVNDTRLPLDQRNPTTPCMNAPVGLWPTSAELDTFLFARGGFPWRCYPAGTITTPGLFAEYDFDTVGTRALPGGLVPASLLARYRRVIWLTNSSAVLLTGPASQPSLAMSAMRRMSSPGMQNPLGEYARSGGQIWLVGASLAAATIPYDVASNNTTNPAPGLTFSSLGGTELAPGRLAYDLAGWQSEIKVSFSPMQITRFLGRFQSGGSIYDGLPTGMRTKSAASDPYPPGRSVVAGNFYTTNFDLEYLSKSNRIWASETPGSPGFEESVLDTLYRAAGPSLVPPSFNFANVSMTVHRPAFAPNPVIDTGFDLWRPRREDSKALVDFVLQKLWNMHPAPSSRIARADP